MKPLHGLKILDFSTLLPGPYATMLLADMGAEVLRVESPVRPDLVREMSPKMVTEAGSQSVAFACLNRGKQSMTLDLKHPEAKGIVQRLLAHYDVLIEQFRPGVMARLGLDYASLSAHNPRLIYCAITGYGQDGPWRDKAGHDINYLALSGISAQSGRVDSGPGLLGTQLADIAAGSHPAALAVLAAVIQRQQTGQGQFIDIAMRDQCLALQPLTLPGILNGAEEVTPESHLLNGGSIYDYYRTADGGYLAVGSLEPKFRRLLVDELGHPEWFSLSDTALKPCLKEVFQQAPLAEWAARFAKVDACVEPVLNVQSALEASHTAARPLLAESAEGVRQLLPLPQLQGMNTSINDAPQLGENTQAVLKKVGFSDAECAHYLLSGVLGAQTTD